MTVRHRNSGIGPIAPLCSTALLMPLLLGLLSPAFADGGAGGYASYADSGEDGGAGGTLDNPQGGDGGGGGGGGPGGGAGSGGQGDGDGGDGGEHGFVGDSLPTTDVNGAAGGNGGDGRYAGTGSGGGGGGGGAGGYGAILDNGGAAAVANGQTIFGGSGGNGGRAYGYGGAGGGGDGGLAFSFLGETLTNEGTINGGAGGDGMDSEAGASGRGGDGGLGLSFSGGSVTNAGTISGGAGGDGEPGNSSSGGGVAGRGGDGGLGLSFSGEALTNTGMVSGGAGGDGGYGPDNLAGNGGVGIAMSAGTLTNTNSIGGGAGGAVDGDDSANGAGGVGIVGSDLHVINSGMISGGLAGDGVTRADAIAFTGGSNRLELQAGSTIIGNVVAGGGNNVLALGGATDAIFDVSGMGAGLQYQGFTDFEKNGTSTWTLEGNGSGFAGNTVIAAGTLIVGSDTAHSDVVLGGSFEVQAGGTLGGIGTVGSGAGSTVTIASGGTIAPGNSIGTLTVDGDIIFASGSIFEAEINPVLASDLIDASGAATIHGGTVHALKAGGVYTPDSRWTIIGADGGVTGTFDELTQNMPFVDLALAYDANNVYIDATRNQVAFCDVAATVNQCSTGDGLETTGAGSPIYDAVAALADEDSARQALDALSGEIHASTKAALIEDSRFVRDAVNNRIRAALGDVAPSMPIMVYGPDGTEIGPAATEPFAAWGHAFGSWGSFDGDGNAAGFDHDTGGLLMGVDGLVTETWRLGLLAGYSHSSFDSKDRASSGSSDNYHLGLYAGTEWGNLGFRSGLAYTRHDIETGRTISLPGFTDSLEGNYDAGAFQAFGELGYKIDTAVASFEPFANLAYVSLSTDAFAEKGGAAALHSQSQTTDAAFTTLGIRASTDFDLGGMKATAGGMLGWRHAFGDLTPFSTHTFAGADAFAVAGAPIAQDAALLEAGLDLNLTDTATLGIAYQGQFASDAQQHGFKANFAIRF